MGSTLIDIVEAGYRLGGTTEDWLHGVSEAFLRCGLPTTWPVVAYTYTIDGTPPALHILDVVARDHGPIDPAPARGFLMTFARLLAPIHLAPEPFSSVRQKLGPLWPALRLALSANGVENAADMVGINASDADGFGCCLGVVVTRPLDAAALELDRWSRVAAHLTAAYRLRRRLSESGRTQADLEGCDAILSPTGVLLHDATGRISGDGRAALLEAAVAVDRARVLAGRGDEFSALHQWRGLIDGRWTLVDHFDTDGRHYVCVRRNAPRGRQVTGLTPRERQVLGFLARGHQQKFIAYELGVSEGAVSQHVSAIKRKLGIDSTAHLRRVFGAAPLELFSTVDAQWYDASEPESAAPPLRAMASAVEPTDG